MIGKIKGFLVEIDQNIGYIETSGGITYKTYLTKNFILTHNKDKEITIYTYLQVKDDGLVLFGFETKKEEKFFSLLLTVPGVGPKTAFNILTNTSIENVIHAVKTNSVSFFSTIPGLGKKTAMKIILELSSKLKSDFQLERIIVSDDDRVVIDALLSLGFDKQEVHKFLSKIPSELPVEDKIKKLLILFGNKT